MGFMDKVKAQAAGLAEKAQEGAKAGQAKLSDMQAKKHADALLLELGGLVYSDQAGRGTPEGEKRSAAIIEELRQHEATNGPVAVTTALVAPPAPDGTSFVPAGAGAAPDAAAPPAAAAQPAAPIPTAVPDAGGVPQSTGGVPQQVENVPQSTGGIPTGTYSSDTGEG
jgi:hypothetical protein